MKNFSQLSLKSTFLTYFIWRGNKMGHRLKPIQ